MGRWRGGQSGNPCCRMPLPIEIRRLRAISTEEIIKLFSKYLLMKESDIESINTDNLTLLEGWFLTNIKKAVKEGNHKVLDKILDRIIGRSFQGIRIELPQIDDDKRKLRPKDVAKITRDIKKILGNLNE